MKREGWDRPDKDITPDKTDSKNEEQKNSVNK